MKKIIFLLSIVMCITTACQKETVHENPFFNKWAGPYELPPFEQITVENYREGLTKGMEEQLANIQAIVENTEEPSFQNVIVAMDASGELLSKVAGVFYAQASAIGTPEILELKREMALLSAQHGSAIMMNKALFNKIEYVKENTDESTLSDEERMLLNLTYSDFIRGGAMLKGDVAVEFSKMEERLSELENIFGENLLAENTSYQLVIDNEEQLKGLSDDLKQAAYNRAAEAGMEGKWIFGLDNPSIMPFLAAADNRELRKEIFNAYLNRCNNNNEYDNKAVIEEITTLRKQMANLLGYESFADYALERRMASEPSDVYTLLNQIWNPAIVKANEELAEMQEIAGKEFAIEASDWRYYAGKLKESKYSLSNEMIRPYLKSDNVREGIFWLCEQLYGITFKPLNNVSLPHPDATAYLCLDNDGKTELGVLYIDLFARPGEKRGGAWCGTYRDASMKDGKRIIPLTYITCNFTPPLGNEPSLLTPDETETFFHEFGHALHNLFKMVKYNGTVDVERDFVELPSQIMEHWAFEPEVLAKYATHYQTGEVIPNELVEKMQAASKYGQGFATTEFLAAALLDMDYHLNKDYTGVDPIKFEKEVLNDNRGLLKEIPPRYRSTYFQHTFTGGYSAGYYSYIWSEVLDSDAYQAFQETGNIFNKEVAEKFRRNILEKGGIYPAAEMYQNFRGSQPSINALLDNRGLDKSLSNVMIYKK